MLFKNFEAYCHMLQEEELSIDSIYYYLVVFFSFCPLYSIQMIQSMALLNVFCVMRTSQELVRSYAFGRHAGFCVVVVGRGVVICQLGINSFDLSSVHRVILISTSYRSSEGNRSVFVLGILYIFCSYISYWKYETVCLTCIFKRKIIIMNEKQSFPDFISNDLHVFMEILMCMFCQKLQN